MRDNKSKQAYQKVIEYINEQVDTGTLGRGDKVPSERKLVEILGIGRNSIREALEILDILGILDRRQGDGTYIREHFDNWFVQPMTLGYLLSETRRNEIFEFRNMIEVEIAELAAQRITDDEIETLSQCYERLRQAKSELEASKLDKLFHSLLAKASKNAIIANSYNAIDYMLDLFIYDMRVEAYKDKRQELVDFVHRNLFDAVVTRDPVEAREAMKRHMNIIRKYFE